tara:strand:- start:603 stop:776 length:174 start_codon:yes stop_codon:yes gene_type:complete
LVIKEGIADAGTTSLEKRLSNPALVSGSLKQSPTDGADRDGGEATLSDLLMRASAAL